MKPGERLERGRKRQNPAGYGLPLHNYREKLGPKSLRMHQRLVKFCKKTCSKLEVYASYPHRFDLPAGSYTLCGARDSRIASLVRFAANRVGRNSVTRGAHALSCARWAAEFLRPQELVSQHRFIEPRRRAADQTDPVDCAQLSGSQRGSKAASPDGEGEVQDRRLG